MKLPTIRTDDKHSQEEAEPGRNSDVEKVRREKTRDGKSQKREDAGVRIGREVAKHLWKWRDVEKVHAIVAWSTFIVKMLKVPRIRTTF